jgi:septal ring factor EnvC (AmiA/AmiB activator)
LAVGLGTGNKEVVANNLMNILKTQMAILQVPPTPAAKGIQETARQLAKAYGFANPELFFPDVPAQPPVDPKQIQAAMQQLQQVQQQIEQQQKALEEGKQQLEKQAMDLKVEQITLDANKHVAQHEASFREKKISMAAKEAGTDENGEDPANAQFEALAQAMMQLAQMMEQTLRVVSAPKVLKRLPDGTKTAVPLLN